MNGTITSIGKDYCFDPQYLNDPLVNVADCATYSCERCHGFCNSDTQCKDDLKCFQRNGLENVPGCGPGGMSGKFPFYL